LDEEEKELLSSVLDEEEIAKIEQMILKRSISENLEKLNRPIGHALQPRPGVESFAYANLIDVSAVIPFAGMLTEWALFVSQPGWIALQVWRPAPADGSFPENSFSLMGETVFEPDRPGLARLRLRKEEAIMCEPGDVLGWRVDGDPVLPYDAMDEGLTRISRSPILKPDLGRTEHFPFSVARTYSVQAKVVSMVLIFDTFFCDGERIEIIDESVDFCSLRYIDGSEVNGRARSVMVPGGLRVQFFKICGQTDSVEIDIDNRANPAPMCKGLPGVGPAHIKLIRG